MPLTGKERVCRAMRLLALSHRRMSDILMANEEALLAGFAELGSGSSALSVYTP
jgi:hypothetical protein